MHIFSYLSKSQLVFVVEIYKLNKNNRNNNHDLKLKINGIKRRKVFKEMWKQRRDQILWWFLTLVNKINEIAMTFMFSVWCWLLGVHNSHSLHYFFKTAWFKLNATPSISNTVFKLTKPTTSYLYSKNKGSSRGSSHLSQYEAVQLPQQAQRQQMNIQALNFLNNFKKLEKK